MAMAEQLLGDFGHNQLGGVWLAPLRGRDQERGGARGRKGRLRRNRPSLDVEVQGASCADLRPRPHPAADLPG